MQTVNFDIGQLLKKVRAGHFLIPQFQRDFTWKEGQTKLLIDSIARNYPVGSLLVLGKNEAVPLKSRKLDAAYPPKHDQENLEETFDEPTAESYYVLDGQQRLTSIARVFLDAHPNRNYYFDLKRMHELFSGENPSWIISRARGRKNPERKENNRLIRTDIALNQERCDVFISEYIEDSGEFPEFEDKNSARRASARLKGIFETIRKFSIPFVILDNDAPLESVCRVFETINSTGTRLTTFDLAVARYYPTPDLKELLDSSNDRYPVPMEYEVDGERVLQILSLYQLRNKNKFPEATRSVLLSLEPEFINANWHSAAFNLSEVCEWVKQLGATAKTEPPHGVLVSIAAALMCFPGSLNKANFSTVLKKWYFCTTLAATPSPANNYKIGDDFRKLCNYLDTGEHLTYPRVHFTRDEIIDVRHHTDSRYKAIQAVMRMTSVLDLMTGNKLNGDLEDHHIFPYSLTKSGINKNKINSIVNRIIISKDSNRTIGNTNPDKYIADLISLHKKEGTLPELDRRLRDCLFPYSSQSTDIRGLLHKDKFDAFLCDRADTLIDRLRSVVGEAWREPANLDDTNLDDDETVAD
jgi:hypothetical protein